MQDGAECLGHVHDMSKSVSCRPSSPRTRVCCWRLPLPLLSTPLLPLLPRRGVVCTAAQEAIRPPSQFAHRLGVDDAELATELSHVFCRYVGIGLDHELEAEEPVANAGGGSTRPSARPTFSTV